MSIRRRYSTALLPLALLCGALCAAPVGAADEGSVKLREGPGIEEVRARCALCHSLDYIQMNSPFLKRAGWEAEVRKMIHVMGAPISDEEMARILDYLGSNYSAGD